MATQRVQNYLKKHKIGSLFESLKARVIQDTPDDPVGYIINILQDIHERQSKQLENSFNGYTSPRLSSRQSDHSEKKGHKRRSNHLAASWSAGLTQQERVEETRNRSRPWTGNDEQSIKNKTWSSYSTSQPPWNNDTRVPTHDFDELFQIQQGDLRIPQKQSTEIHYTGVRNWKTPEKPSLEQKNSFHFGDDDDEINRELRLGQKSSSIEKSEFHTSRTRPVKSKLAVEKHRQELQALLLEDENRSQTTNSVGHSPEERGTEVLERIEDLENEGVSDSHSTVGVKLNKSRRDDKKLSVTICARCARIIGNNDDDDILSQATSSDFSGKLFDDVTRKQDFKNFDDESETSEIVTAREKNAWHFTDSENESSLRTQRTTFKNKTFDSFTRKEFKHMDESGDETSPQATHRSSSTRQSKSSNFPTRGFPDTSRNAWHVNSDDESVNDVTPRRPTSARSQAPSSINGGKPWYRSPGNDSDNDSNLS